MRRERYAYLMGVIFGTRITQVRPCFIGYGLAPTLHVVPHLALVCFQVPTPAWPSREKTALPDPMVYVYGVGMPFTSRSRLATTRTYCTITLAASTCPAPTTFDALPSMARLNPCFAAFHRQVTCAA